jgi:hypothetical protein
MGVQRVVEALDDRGREVPAQRPAEPRVAGQIGMAQLLGQRDLDVGGHHGQFRGHHAETGVLHLYAVPVRGQELDLAV